MQFKKRDKVLSKAEAKQERELTRKHWRTWVGPLAPVATHGAEVQFERGFPSRAGAGVRAGVKVGRRRADRISPAIQRPS